MMSEEIFQSKQAREIIQFVADYYGDKLEFLWENSPSAIWRHVENRKWYALMTIVRGDKVGLESDELVEALNLRFVKGEASYFAAANPGIIPGYHMNKQNWITIALNETVTTEMIFGLLEQSYELTMK